MIEIKFLELPSKPNSTSTFLASRNFKTFSFFHVHFHRTIKTAGLIKRCHCKTLFEDSWQRRRVGGR